jgi:TetR/AcrR family transcriptional repressor of nem operon
LTHGGFYRHFESKEALFSEACLRAFAEAAEVAGDVMKRPDGMRLFRNGYLADERVYGTPECPLATLGSDVARQGPEVQAVFAEGLRRQLASSGHAIGTPEWEQATANIAMLVGAMVMARSVRKVDEELAEAVVKAVKKKEDRKITKPVTRA